jgi:hypothetical protein
LLHKRATRSARAAGTGHQRSMNISEKFTRQLTAASKVITIYSNDNDGHLKTALLPQRPLSKKSSVAKPEET